MVITRALTGLVGMRLPQHVFNRSDVAQVVNNGPRPIAGKNVPISMISNRLADLRNLSGRGGGPFGGPPTMLVQSGDTGEKLIATSGLIQLSAAIPPLIPLTVVLGYLVWAPIDEGGSSSSTPVPYVSGSFFPFGSSALGNRDTCPGRQHLVAARIR